MRVFNRVSLRVLWNIALLLIFILPLNAKKNHVAALSSTNSTITHEPFIVDIVLDDNSEKFILLLKNPQQHKLQLSIKGIDGNLYSFETTSALFRKRFNLAQAEDGIYFLTVTDGKHAIKRQIYLKTNTLVTRSLSADFN